MTAYRPDRRDPLTMRYARTVAETREDPWACSEGPAEPQPLIVEQDVEHAADRMLRRWGAVGIVLVLLLIAIGVL